MQVCLRGLLRLVGSKTAAKARRRSVHARRVIRYSSHRYRRSAILCAKAHRDLLRPSQRVDVRYLAQALESDFVFSQSSAIATGIAQKTKDIVFSLDRPFIATGVKVARLSATDVPSLLLQRVGRVLFKDTHLTPEYLLLWMQSTDFVRQIDAGRSNGVPHVSSKQVEAAVLTVPDATEQRRVVTRIRELLRICDRLEARLVTTEAETERLMEAVLRRALLSASHQSADLGRMPAAHA